MKRVLTSGAVLGVAFALSTIAASAAGPYDGTWQVETSPTRQGTPAERTRGCEPVRFQFTVKDNQIQGDLARSTSARGGAVPGKGPGSSPITGTVKQDGTVDARWENIDATGKLQGDKAEIRWQSGDCGPRVATGQRIASTEGMGSSTKGQ
jgi:hypothetical protein